MGSSKEVKNAPVDMTAKVTETLEALIAPKKVSQCTAMIKPAIKKPVSTFLENRRLFFLNKINNPTNPVANNILYQTNGIASSEISAPSTAV